ncbi:DUF4167 domain-containing protein [Rhizobium sp. CNPSo 4062]|uniref:DUF4167 domain-containing protein n=1 Tax=Rhizobium sp. CNPSo 4062 TaxID=3021410 RepID=UPI00254D4EEA|nr:DUF4167 domain-containing protein [Rhizobium sp. CNPSo 4062]MDK4704436.1 DUF4167 domain-containing protein [Rhizobium sp. CNPSo 4062]
MRPGQQNKRGRGRGNNNNGGGGGNNNNNFNRKGSNPLTRTYDSSGPDVKIRGTAQHIAEKYAALARDAQSSGDRVMAENYLQHAEHYNRIIASAQAQMQERYQRDDHHNYNDRDNAERDIDDMDAQEIDDQPQMAQPHVRQQQAAPAAVAAPAREPETINGTGPQPVIEGIPAEVAIEEETPAVAATERQPRRRSAGGNRPRRQPRRSAASGEGEDQGEAASGDTPALADVASE